MTSPSPAIEHPCAQRTITGERLIGCFHGRVPGPTLICLGGIHGNEPAGVQALDRVCTALKQGNVPWEKGHFYAFRGNLEGLRRHVRYIDQDLNRIWRRENIRDIEKRLPGERTCEERELLELHGWIREILSRHTPPFYFLDLHTTSSQTLPFITINDAVINRKFASLFPVPVILGIEEYLGGPLLSYINELGYVSMGFESGQHDCPRAVDYAEDFLWLTLAYSGLLAESNIPEFQQRQIRLREGAEGDHHFYEVFHRHGLEDPSAFRMVQGYRSFEEVPKGRLLAHDHGTPVYMGKPGMLFMPLYQKQGEEGFFLIRKIPSWALRFSAWLRRFRFQDVLVLLPGIRWTEKGSDTLLVDLRVARFFSKPIFHLLGYRSRFKDHSHLVLSNRERPARNADYQGLFWFERRNTTPG
ncbi:succinylglutamate desuccinylase/aspartoacylase family protein [Robiginitalea sp. M366]|uniref:succinylglutamate desuccinylase/aspartoacylase family protein n=1 Tax=Robiginitalea aestuariiviva TaxID=3036903 RepID=UPI00240D3479|nr:succinylglutamate desuccinylase/aspartoacylase family protein [Robiginitalea aestuariiviva]MDG1571526.1 succinylglutamate desuccinylase/aspartoacylase family protein [Robiginitalea aestuariiviva]